MSITTQIPMDAIEAAFRTTKPARATDERTDAMRRLPFADAAWPVWRSATARSR
ncbi:MAG: hypothetical protein KDJ88_04635 [Bauldia sp.]|nr:hypothetical protein [Bauldia sp.]